MFCSGTVQKTVQNKTVIAYCSATHHDAASTESLQPSTDAPMHAQQCPEMDHLNIQRSTRATAQRSGARDGSVKREEATCTTITGHQTLAVPEQAARVPGAGLAGGACIIASCSEALPDHQGLWADGNAASLTDKQLDDLTLLLEQVTCTCCAPTHDTTHGTGKPRFVQMAHGASATST